MNSREKGKRGEREVANILKEHGWDAHRGVQYKGGPDSPDVVGLPHVHIEVKRCERTDIPKWYEQSFRDAGEGEIPIVVHKKNREPWMVTMTFEDWMKMFAASDYAREW